MKSKSISFTDIQIDGPQLEKKSNNMELTRVFGKRDGYLNEYNLFIAHFNEMENTRILSTWHYNFAMRILTCRSPNAEGRQVVNFNMAIMELGGQSKSLKNISHRL